MSHILGLDLGSYSVKGVLWNSALRGQPVQGYFEVPRAQEGDEKETLLTSIKALKLQIESSIDQVLVALPGPSLATHAFAMPFSDPKRLEAALPFEVESQLPYDLSEAVFDYQPTARQEDRTELLVSVVRVGELTALLDVLKQASADPRVVTHPAIAYQALWLTHPDLFNAGHQGPIAVLDIGHLRTSIAVGVPGGELEFARTFAGGGKDLTRSLATELQVSWAEANHWKEHQASVGTQNAGEPDGERVSAALVRGLQPMLRELRPTLKAYTARTRRAVGQIYLCGGTSKLPGLAEQLTRDLGIPTERLQLPSDAQTVISAEQAPSSMQALALAARGSLTGPKAPRFNLRRGELAFKGDFNYLRKRVGRVAAYAVALYVLFIIYGIARGSMLSRREAEVDAQLCSLTQRTLGRCEKNFDKALSILRGKEGSAAQVPRLSAVNMLAEMTQRIPSDVKVTFDEIQVDNTRMSLQGTTESSKQVDRITQALKGYKCFHEIQVGKLDKTKDDHVNFRVEVQVDCPGEPTPAAG